MSDRLRVVLAEDNYLVREGTSRLLEDTGDIDVVATAGDAAQLLRVVDEHRPDVVITDIRMPPNHSMEGIEAAHAIRRDHPDTGVVVLSQYADGSYALELFKDGTAGLGYMLKERVGDLEDLLAAITNVASGGSTIDPQVVEVLVDARSRASRSLLKTLTPRELEVLGEMAQGKNNAGVASSLHLSESAVEKHVSAIFLKLGVSEQPQLSRRVSAVLAFLHDQPPADI
jgi:DNA-binding NarL/FixJ family response regulator